MDAGVAGLIGALGGSLLSGGLVWLVGERQRKQNLRDAEAQDRIAAYAALLTTSMNMTMRIQTVGDTKRLRSGIQEGLAVTLGQRKPLDLMELYDWFNQDGSRLNDAWMRVWAVGTQEAIDAADRLMDGIGDLMAAAVAENPEIGRLRMTLFGAGRSAAQAQAFDAAMRTLAERQVAFVQVLRKEDGAKTVEFALERARRAT
jgi:hypothetical protein